jgi:photosystem II stability/assembly factor-like uncharacterized protein
MRLFPTLSALCLVGLAAAPVRAEAPRHFDDAALHAVQFVDGREGWAVGDEGVVWHTIDAGKTWEQQQTGVHTSVRASLRGLHFLNPYVGWVVGREEMPAGAGSVGVVLFTKDGGLHWKRVMPGTLPGLNCVAFADDQNGFLAGDASDAYPTGVFVTRDGGRTWQAVPGPRATSWWALACTGPGEAALAGAWNRQALVSRDRLHIVDTDLLGGRTLRGLRLSGTGGVAVGEGGLVLLSDGARGARWSFDPRLPPHAAENWDFHAIHGVGPHLWAVGRPGSAALHSPDGGKSWEVVRTGQTLPLHGVFFSDEGHGWAVGELGTVIATTDGGKSWRVQRRGGQRLAVLTVNARAAGTPLDTLAVLGLQEGYLAAGLRVTSPDPASAAPHLVGDGPRFADALRQCGAAGGEVLWQFPLPSHLAQAPRKDLLRSWDQLHGDRAAEQLLRQLVLALRMWRPDVVLTDAAAGECGADGLMAEALRAAFERAADPQAFPEQVKVLGLEPWSPVKLYGQCDPRACSVSLDLVEPDHLLEGTVKEFVTGPAALLAEGSATVPARRGFRLLASRLQGASSHQHLMQGIELAAGGLARRPAVPLSEPPPELLKALRQRTHLLALVEAPLSALTGPDKVLSQVGPMLAELPDEVAVRAAHAVASEYVRRGQWALARETFLLLIDRYPAHPLALDACRWVIRHNSSSEARRRHELGQFLVTVRQQDFGQPQEKDPAPMPDAEGVRPASFDTEGPEKKPRLPNIPEVQVQQQGAVTAYASPAQARQWYQSSLDLESRLAAFGPLAATDPSLQFCLQAARRNLGGGEEALKWYEDFARRQPPGPWRTAAAAELWLARRGGPPPRPVLKCRPAETRPLLDGRLDDACWQGAAEERLQNAAGETAGEYPTAVRLAFDQEFLYLAVRCKHPVGKAVPPARGRQRDADLRAYDRVSVLLDIDRDYNTCYHLQIDQRGCVCESCWGDRDWNPRWFVAVHAEQDGWVAEAAIPLTALTGDAVTPGKAWACNVVRVLPGLGVQALSLPAEAPEVALRPEGMGLLLFTQEPRAASAEQKSAAAPGR